MTEIQAVVGRIQLRRMQGWTAKRRGNASMIREAAKNIWGLRVPDIPEWAGHAAYKCYVFVDPDALKDAWNRDKIIAAINDKGVPCYSGVCPEIYLEKAFDNTGWRPRERLPIAKQLGEASLMFLVHPTLEEEHINRTCTVLREVMKDAVK